ncbi:DUF4429 domain-containing protein [Streptomyces sp. INA 01156]
MEPDRYGVAEYFTDEVRNALLLDQVPSDPVPEYLLPGPSVPLSASAGDGSVSFDGERIRLEWNWKTEEASPPPAPHPRADRHSRRGVGAGDRTGERPPPFPRAQRAHQVPAKYDPNAVELWGFKKDPLMALVAAAVQARLPHPAARDSVPALGGDTAQDRAGHAHPAEPEAAPVPPSPPPRTSTTRCCAGCASWANCTAPAS